MSLNRQVIVRVVKDWDHINLYRQTQDGKGKWKNFCFTDKEIDECDVLVVFNSPHKKLAVKCRSGCTFLISHEPPIKRYDWMRNSFREFDYVFTQFKSKNSNHILTHGSLPWWIEKNYSELLEYERSSLIKRNRISTIISNREDLPGHKTRLSFVNFMKKQKQVPFDLFGKGFEYVPSKFDCLKQYKYTLCLENTSKPHYWTEKISDAFLSFSMPIYYGATNIFEYFPKESLIQIDINEPKIALQKIDEAVKMNLFEKNFEAIIYARSLILNKFQFFPFITDFIQKNIPDILERDKVLYSFKKNYWPRQSLKEKIIKSLTYRK